MFDSCSMQRVHRHANHLVQQAELATTAAATARLEDQLRHVEEELEAAHGEWLIDRWYECGRCLFRQSRLSLCCFWLTAIHLPLQRWWSSSG